MNRRRLRLLLAAVCLAALGTAAADGKNKKGQTLQSMDGQSVELPPDAPIPDAERQARENYRQYRVLQKADPKQSAEALRRLGDLELEAGETQALTSPGVDPLNAATYQKAVKLYQQLLAEHPNYPRNDLVLYQLARAQESGGDPVAALSTLDRLVAKYPQSPLMDEVQFRRGEILFPRRRYEEAEAAYAAVLALDAKSRFHEQALYKRGWALFKQDRHQEALDSFYQLLDTRLGNIPPAEVDHELDALPRPARELVDDTMRVMSLSEALMDGEKTLREDLRRHNEPAYGHLLYLNLAALYMDEKRYTDAAGVLMGFVEAQPLHPRAPYLQMQAVNSLEQAKFPDEALAARLSFVQRFGLDQPFWSAHPQADNQPVIDFLRESVWTLAQYHHGLAQAREQTAAERGNNYRQAAEGYRRYLAYFPQDPKAPEAQFLLGEALFEVGDYAAAVTAYEAAAYNYPPHPRSAESGYAALIAYQKQETQLGGDDKAAWHRRSLEAQLRFAAAFPDDSRAIPARMNVTNDYIAQGALPQAIDAALPITTAAQASDDQRRFAWMAIGNARFDSHDFSNAEAAYGQAKQLDDKTGRRDADLSERIAASIYRQGEQARDAGHAEQASSAFLRVGQVTPEAKIRATADYDAAQALLNSGQTAAAIPVLLAFRSQYPGNQLQDQVDANLALAYLKTGDNAAAAAAFERIADNPRNDAGERKEALQRAAKLYGQLGDDGGESRALAVFVKRYPDAFDESLEAQQRLIDLAAKRQDRAAVFQLSRAVVGYDAAAGAKRTDRSRYLAARASLRLAEPVRDAFLAIELKAPLKDSIRRKKASMEAALTAYGKAADYGVAEVLTESTYQIGELYYGLAKALYASERPRGLDDQAKEQYDLMLQEQAYPFEEKAIELHEANTRRAREGIYDDWVRSSYASLAVLVPARYGRQEQQEAYVEAIR